MKMLAITREDNGKQIIIPVDGPVMVEEFDGAPWLIVGDKRVIPLDQENAKSLMNTLIQEWNRNDVIHIVNN